MRQYFGSLSSGTTLGLTPDGSPPAVDPDIQTELAHEIAAKTVAPLVTDRIYVIMLPPGVTSASSRMLRASMAFGDSRAQS